MGAGGGDHSAGQGLRVQPGADGFRRPGLHGAPAALPVLPLAPAVRALESAPRGQLRAVGSGPNAAWTSASVGSWSAIRGAMNGPRTIAMITPRMTPSIR